MVWKDLGHDRQPLGSVTRVEEEDVVDLSGVSCAGRTELVTDSSACNGLCSRRRAGQSYICPVQLHAIARRQLEDVATHVAMLELLSVG